MRALMNRTGRPEGLSWIFVALIVAFAPSPRAQTDASPVRGPFDDLHFRGIGPAGTGGRIHDLQIDPKNPAVLYVGAATGGIWKSTNKGVTGDRKRTRLNSSH